jgi:phosphatidylglycerophosphatase A
MSKRDKVAKSLATWFGSGRFPVAPGTVGSVATLPLHFALRACGPAPHAIVTIGITALGIWAADRAALALGEEDPSAVVIDEVAGTLIALGLAGRTGTLGGLTAFALFRWFDIKKPGLIDSVQRLRPAGLGIMADDVLAGLAAGLATRFVFRVFGR